MAKVFARAALAALPADTYVPSTQRACNRVDRVCVRAARLSAVLVVAAMVLAHTPHEAQYDVGSCSEASCLMRNSAMDDSIGGS